MFWSSVCAVNVHTNSSMIDRELHVTVSWIFSGTPLTTTYFSVEDPKRSNNARVFYINTVHIRQGSLLT